MSNKKATTAEDLRSLIQHDLDGAIAHITAAAKNMQRLAGIESAGAAVKAKQAKQTAKSSAKPAARPSKKAKKPAAAEQKTPDTQARQGEENVQPAPRHRTPASVILTPHEITLNIGAHPVKELADDDAKDMLNNPKIFWYRPIQFPDPRRYQVQPHIEAVKVIKRTDPKFTRAPWTCSVTISLIGDDKRCDSYGVGVLSKNKSEQE